MYNNIDSIIYDFKNRIRERFLYDFVYYSGLSHTRYSYNQNDSITEIYQIQTNLRNGSSSYTKDNFFYDSTRLISKIHYYSIDSSFIEPVYRLNYIYKGNSFYNVMRQDYSKGLWSKDSLIETDSISATGKILERRCSDFDWVRQVWVYNNQFDLVSDHYTYDYLSELNYEEHYKYNDNGNLVEFSRTHPIRSPFDRDDIHINYTYKNNKLSMMSYSNQLSWEDEPGRIIWCDNTNWTEYFYNSLGNLVEEYYYYYPRNPDDPRFEKIEYYYENKSVNVPEAGKISMTTISVYPNPATDYIEISGFNPNPQGVVECSDIRIYNTLGVVVIKNPTPALTERKGVRLDVSFLTPGLYFVRYNNQVYRFLKI